MTNQMLHLAKNGHDYVFEYRPGSEGEIIDELTRQAGDPRSGIDWSDAAMLSFQVAQYTAIDCAAAVMSPGPAQPAPHSPKPPTGWDDAKDGPCTNTNYP